MRRPATPSASANAAIHRAVTRASGLVALLAALLLACQPAQQTSPESMQIVALLDGSTLQVLQVNPVSPEVADALVTLGRGQDPVEATSATLGYRVVAADPLNPSGAPDRASLASGTLVDPRIQRIERASAFVPLHDVPVTTSTALITLVLPAALADGRLELLNGDAKADGVTVLASAPLSMSPASRTLALTGNTPAESASPIAGASTPPASNNLPGFPRAVRFAGSKEPAKVVNVLFVPSGYGDLDRFHRDIDAAFRVVLAHPAYRDYTDRINGWYIDDRSLAESDLIQATVSNGTLVRYVASGSDTSASGVTEELYLPAAAGAKDAFERHTYVSLNASTEPHVSGRVLAHELGHALLGLGDEYETSQCDPSTLRYDDKFAPNVSSSTDRSTLKWRDLVSANVPLPTPSRGEYSGAVGAFEGASRCRRGAYRPTQSCLMRDSSTDHMCAVCARELGKLFAQVDERLGKVTAGAAQPAMQRPTTPASSAPTNPSSQTTTSSRPPATAATSPSGASALPTSTPPASALPWLPG